MRGVDSGKLFIKIRIQRDFLISPIYLKQRLLEKYKI